MLLITIFEFVRSRSNHRMIYNVTFDQNAIKERSRGLMDKALPSGGKDCEFESCRDRFFSPFFLLFPAQQQASEKEVLQNELHFTNQREDQWSFFFSAKLFLHQTCHRPKIRLKMVCRQ